jgi:hypothetical protein
MVEKRVDRSRRNVMRAVARGVTAGLLLRISQNAAEETIAQALKDGTLIEVQHGNENKKDKGKDQSANRGATADRT